VTVALLSKRPDSTFESINFLITGTSRVRADLIVYAMAPSTIVAQRLSGRTGLAANGKSSTELAANGPWFQYCASLCANLAALRG
jgi:hypothetical protein